MRFILLVLVYMIVVDCAERCSHPQGEDGDQISEGCLLRSCEAGVWRTSLAGNLCCYEGTAYTINTTISSSMSQDECVKVDIDCVEEIPGQAKMILSMRNSCEEFVTQEQLEEIKELLERQREAGVGCKEGDKEGEVKEDLPLTTHTSISPVILSEPLQIYKAKGETAKLHCKVKHLGDRHLVWRRGYEVLATGHLVVSADPRISVEKHSGVNTLVLKHISEQDAGEYVCQISILNDTLSVKHRLDVLVNKTLLIGPGYSNDGQFSFSPKSVVLRLPDCSKLFDDGYYGYVGRYTSDGIHMCGGMINDDEASSCFLVTTEGLKDMPRLLTRRTHSAAIMTPHGWWVTGGYGGYDESVEEFWYGYDTTELWSNNQWQEHVRLPVKMSSHCMTWVNQSHILLTGGDNFDDDEEGDSSAAAYLYSEETGFTRIEDMKTPRSRHGCSVINESLVFVAGGPRNKKTEYLDLATLKWFHGPELPYPLPLTESMMGDMLVGRKKFKLEKLGLSVGQWQWVEVGEFFQDLVISEKFCN